MRVIPQWDALSVVAQSGAGRDSCRTKAKCKIVPCPGEMGYRPIIKYKFSRLLQCV